MAQEQRQREQAKQYLQEQAKQYAQVVAKASQDEAFKQRLLGNPQAVLAEHGLAVPAGKTVRVVENTAETVYLLLPIQPADLSDEQLDQVAGGVDANGGDADADNVSGADLPPAHHLPPYLLRRY